MAHDTGPEEIENPHKENKSFEHFLHYCFYDFHKHEF